MATFQELQTKLSAIRSGREAARTAVFRTREALDKLNRQRRTLQRGNAQHPALGELGMREEVLQTTLKTQEANLAQLLAGEAEVLRDLQAFADPRKTLGEFPDQFPFLLFPVRLETRFKQIRLVTGAVQHQLWVRIFPDDCSVDAFEGTLSEAEAKNARTYWTNVWRAGQSADPLLAATIGDIKRSAWRGLAGTTQAGRAYWITGQYQPLNPGALPPRTAPGEVILVIAAEELPAGGEQAALAAYWSAAWQAGGDAAAGTARRNLVAAVGEERAGALLAAYVPANLADPNPGEGVQVAFLHLPPAAATATKRQAWSQAPRVTTFPERFVLMGTRGGADVFPPQLGEPVPDPLVIGPDPLEDIDSVLRQAYANGEIGDGSIAYDAVKDEDKASLYVEYLSRKSETRWLFDFDAAIGNGLGFKVDLTADQYQAGFDRLLVLGVRLGADAAEGQAALETLLRNHHFGAGGLGILPQGTPTNNTEKGASGFSGGEDADVTYERYFGTADTETPPGGGPPEPRDPHDRNRRKDGRWLADLLGVDADASTLRQTANYYHTDQREALAMNAALWPATLGYFLESMMGPVLGEWQRSVVQWYSTNYVTGRGPVPAIRIGKQPYGILPVSALGRAKWLFERGGAFPLEGLANMLPTLQELYQFLMRVRGDWSAFHAQVAQVGQAGDPHQVLLDVLGLQASSQEFYQRYAKGFTHLYNYLLFLHPMLGSVGLSAGLLHMLTPRELLRKLGYDPNSQAEQPAILEKAFISPANLMKGPLIDDRPLSETQPIRAYTDDGRNYIGWLIDSALAGKERLRDQTGFSGDQRPAALLYQMLRHALDLSFFDSGLKLYRRAGVLDDKEVHLARRDADFTGFVFNQNVPTSKWEYLHRVNGQVTPDQETVAQHVSNLLRKAPETFEVAGTAAVVEALRRLAHAPTARLERAFAEHLDTCTYRLDAWLLGLVNLQLAGMRYGKSFGAEGKATPGVYLGAFGWVENLKPDDRVLTPATLSPELADIFKPTNDSPLLEDSTNAGYVHAPSVNHAVTAAVLRNAYLSNASNANAESFKVNLSSERVRMALGIIEGMQQGQSLGALLGYQLERGLHDRHAGVEVDKYIYRLRKAFPLVANRLQNTVVADADTQSITQLEARNVVDGLALVEHIEKTGQTTYPFGKDLGDAGDAPDANQQQAINAEVDRIRNLNDAVADLALAESVHQVVQGNYDRAAGTLDAFSKGGFPPTPDVVQTPRSGIGLTHRVGIHLPASAVPPAGATPRAQAEPRLNAWLATVLPAAPDVVCQVTYALPDGSGPGEQTVSLADLGLAPIDLLYASGGAEGNTLAALDELVLHHVYSHTALRPDGPVEIRYAQAVPGRVTFFELAPLTGSLRSLLLAARPLRPSDLRLPNEATGATDGSVTLDAAPFETARGALFAVAEQAGAAGQPVGSLLDFVGFVPADLTTVVAREAVIDGIDGYVTAFAAQMRRVNAYGVPGAGFAYAYERRRSLHGAVRQKVQAYAARWQAKLAGYNDLVTTQYAAAATEADRFALLQRAERTISRSYTTPLPATADEYKAGLAGKATAFTTKLAAIAALAGPPLPATLSGLTRAVLNLATAAPPLADFDDEGIDLKEEVTRMVVLAEDLVNQANKMRQAVRERVAKAGALLTEAGGAAAPDRKVALVTEAARLLFGDDFQVYPSFALSPEQGSELTNCVNGTAALLAYQQGTLGVDFPVDDWLYGVARVREKMGRLENAVVLAESLRGDAPLPLTPLQLPYAPNDTWLALSYPESLDLAGERLLYTACLPAFDPAQPQCGVLVDEWTEVIPARRETTGLTFHYDKPNNEPPQSLLLVTPAAFTGRWQWNDLVDALHETLDLARTRAVEPAQVDGTAYAQFLPATVSATTVHPITIALHYAINNSLIS